MRRWRLIALGLSALSSVGVGSASAQVLFQDDFEDEPISAADGLTPIGAPNIGVSWTESAGSGAHGIDILGSPAIGTRSMRTQREPAPPLGPSNGQANGLTLPGAIVPGNIVEVKWSNQLSTLGVTKHRFNGPMQMSLGHSNSNYNNDLAFIQVGDAGNGTYVYGNSTAQYGNPTSSGVQPSLDAWDTLRVVMTLTGDATSIGGTYDLFVSIAGGAEQQLANDATLFNTVIPAVDPTSMQLRIGRGPFAADVYYDDLSVTIVPEPTVMALGAGAGGLLALRRRRTN